MYTSATMPLCFLARIPLPLPNTPLHPAPSPSTPASCLLSPAFCLLPLCHLSPAAVPPPPSCPSNSCPYFRFVGFLADLMH